MMSNEQRGSLPRQFGLAELIETADFIKREGDDVSEDLAALERQIMEGLVSSAGTFTGAIPQSLLHELGAEIFDTLLSNYLKWYKCSLIAVSQTAAYDCLAFVGYAQLERPHHLGLGVTYQMQTAPEDGEQGAPDGIPRIYCIPGSVQVLVDASKLVRAAVAALQIEKTVHHMLQDPADIVRKTLQCRLEAVYGYHKRIGGVGLSIANGIVGVTISEPE